MLYKDNSKGKMDCLCDNGIFILPDAFSWVTVQEWSCREKIRNNMPSKRRMFNISQPMVEGTWLSPRARTQTEPLTAFRPPHIQGWEKQEIFRRSCEPYSGRKKTEFSYINFSQALSSPVLFCAEERVAG